LSEYHSHHPAHHQKRRGKEEQRKGGREGGDVLEPLFYFCGPLPEERGRGDDHSFLHVAAAAAAGALRVGGLLGQEPDEGDGLEGLAEALRREEGREGEKVKRGIDTVASAAAAPSLPPSFLRYLPYHPPGSLLSPSSSRPPSPSDTATKRSLPSSDAASKS